MQAPNPKDYSDPIAYTSMLNAWLACQSPEPPSVQARIDRGAVIVKPGDWASNPDAITARSVNYV